MTARREPGTGTIEELPSGKFRGILPGRRGRKLPARATREEAERDLQIKTYLVTNEGVRAHSADGTQLGPYGRRVLLARQDDGYRNADHELSRWRTHIEETTLGGLDVETFTRADVVVWMRARLKARVKAPHRARLRRPRTLSRSVVIDALRILRLVTVHAVDVDQLRRDDPAAGVKVPAALEGETHDPWTYLRPTEVVRLLETGRTAKVKRDVGGLGTADREASIREVRLVPPAEHDAAIVAIYTGLRLGELLLLHVCDVDLERGRLVVRYGSRKGGKLLAPKGARRKRKIRTIQLLAPALEALRRQIARVSERELNPLGLVFPSAGSSRHVGGYRAPRAPKCWAAWIKTARLTPVDREDPAPLTWHSLRHTFATLVLAGKLPECEGEGWRIEMVSAYLGHSAIAVTQRYADVAELL